MIKGATELDLDRRGTYRKSTRQRESNDAGLAMGDVSRDRFLEAMSRAVCAVSLVTTDGWAGPAGATVSAMASLSADGPRPSLLVCMHQCASATRAVQDNGVFCLNFLRTEHMQLCDLFAERAADLPLETFTATEWTTRKTGSPVLKSALVAFDCRVEIAMRYSTHWILVGGVVELVVPDSEPSASLLFGNGVYWAPAPL
jgi:flavin reductase